MPQVFPSVRIIPIDGANWVITYQLSNFLVELPLCFTLPMDSHFHIELKPFFEYWRNGKTAAVNGGVELGVPENTNFFTGAELTLGFEF